MKKLLKKFLFIVTFLAISSKVSSQSQESISIYKNKKFDKACSSSIEKFKKTNKKIKFKLNEQFSNVEAEEIVMKAPEVFTEGKGGRKRVRGLKAPKHYRLKSGNSFGTMTVTEDGVIGSIDSLNITNEGLAPQSTNGQILETADPIEYNSPNGVQNSPVPATAENIVSQSTTMLPQSVRKVYIVDYDLYTQLGSSIQNCLNWAQSLHAGVLPYYQEMGITNTLFKVIVITDVTKSYQNLNTSSETLLKVANDYQNEPGDLIHLLTTKGYGGLAYLSSIGPNSNIRFALSGVFTNLNLNNNYSWTINVVAHEEGHSYGSRHTQWCGWYKPDGTIGRLDTCVAGEGTPYTSGCSTFTKPSGGQGTIMSYCHLNGGINLTRGFFFPQIREQMRRTLMNSGVAGGPTNTCTWTYGPWSPCIALANEPAGSGYQTRTATPNTDICKGYPTEATVRTCVVSPGSPTQPIADFRATYTSGVEAEAEYKVYQNITGPTAVSFKDKSAGIPNTWSWDFGDGKTSTQQNPSNLYSNAGVYRVRLNASNIVGTSSVTKENYVWVVGNNGLPTPDFGAARTNGPAPLIVQFVNLSSTNSWEFIWNFKNSQGTLIGSSREKDPRFTFNNPGVYSVSLFASNKNGSNTVEKTSFITVTGTVTVPVANFTGTPLTGIAPLTVAFTDQSTNTPTNWSWNFGNGAVSSVRNPSTTYSTPGTYSVTLTASNAAGSNQFTRTGYVVVSPASVVRPVASFVGTPLSGSIPLIVQFTDQSTNNPTSWLWNFGNGQTSTVKNPTATYTTAGNYTVSLTATNSAGSNEQVRTDYVTVNGPGTSPAVTVFKKADGLWWIRFTTSSTQSITTDVCRYGLSPCNPALAPQACGGRTSPSTIINGNNEYLMSPQPAPPSPGLWCYRVRVTQGGQIYWSNFFEFLK